MADRQQDVATGGPQPVGGVVLPGPGPDLQLDADLQLSDLELGQQKTAKQLREERDRLDRRLRDSELVARLRTQGPGDPDYEVVALELFRYGHGVLDAWVTTGAVFAKVAARGRGVKTPNRVRVMLREDDHEREDLVVEVVATALNGFLTDAIDNQGWRVDGGASLATYFVGAVILRFSDVYRRRLTQWKNWDANRMASAGGVVVVDDGARSYWDDDPSNEVVRTEERFALLNNHCVNERERHILTLEYHGYSTIETVELLKLYTGEVITPKAVESTRGRIRRRARQNRKGGSDR